MGKAIKIILLVALLAVLAGGALANRDKGRQTITPCFDARGRWYTIVR